MIGYGEPSSRSVTSWTSGATDQTPGAAEQLVHLLRRVREERRQQGVAVLDRLERGVQDGVPAGRVLLELPRRLVRQVLVRLADHPHRLGGRGLLPVAGQQVADRREGARRRRQQRAVGVGQLTGRRDGADVLRRHRHRPVDQVAPAGDELVVVAAEELRPGEVGVLVLRAGDGDEVAQRVGVVAGEEVAHVDDDVARGGELAPLHRQELARDDLGGQVEPAERRPACRPCRPRRCSRAAGRARSRSGRRCCPCP